MRRAVCVSLVGSIRREGDKIITWHIPRRILRPFCTRRGPGRYLGTYWSGNRRTGPQTRPKDAHHRGNKLFGPAVPSIGWEGKKNSDSITAVRFNLRVTKKQKIQAQANCLSLLIDRRFELTFLLASIHFFMAGTEEPVRSLRARRASLMRAMVAILMGWLGCVLVNFLKSEESAKGVGILLAFSTRCDGEPERSKITRQVTRAGFRLKISTTEKPRRNKTTCA